MLTKAKTLEPFKQARQEQMRLAFQAAIDACPFREQARHISDMLELYRDHGMIYDYRARELVVDHSISDEEEFVYPLCVHGVYMRADCPDCNPDE